MKVRQFLNAYNIGRSNAIVTVVNVTNMEQVFCFSKKEIKDADYGLCGDAKLNSFDVIDNKIKIYAEF